jgi:beta-glucanase (GH16 family)
MSWSLAAITAILVKGPSVPDYTFYDDFDGAAGSAPDPTKWTYDLGGGGWGNGELEIYTSARANSYIDGNSNLVIAAIETTAPGGPTYTSARLKTLGLFAQLGGSFEARIQVNSTRGAWPAFWLMGTDINTVSWPKCGEIDIMEDFGYSTTQSSVHAPNGTSTYTQSFDTPGDAEFHVYRADIGIEGVTFFRDDYEYGHTPSNFCPPAGWVFGPAEPNNTGMFILLNLAIGGNVGVPPLTTKFPVTMLVDYVRVWQ